MDKVTPSKSNPFALGEEGEPNARQKAKAKTMIATIMSNRSRYGLPENFGVLCPLEPRAADNWMPRSIRVQCPVIQSTRDRKRLLVIAPDGTDVWVNWK